MRGELYFCYFVFKTIKLDEKVSSFLVFKAKPSVSVEEPKPIVVFRYDNWPAVIEVAARFFEPSLL